jgi:PAS domain S-box-containing protein
MVCVPIFFLFFREDISMKAEKKTKTELLKEMKKLELRLRESEEALQTTQKKNEEFLASARLARVEAENERYRLEAVMEALPVGVSITDTQGGNIRANNAFEQIWGNPRPAAASVSDYAAYKAWWADTGKPLVPEEWASAQAVQKGEPVVQQLLEIQRFDGSHAFVINGASPVRDVAGRIIGSAVAIQDITAHREAETKYSKILATALNGFWISDRQGRFLEVNEALCRMLGYAREELLTLSIADVEADESPVDVLNHIAALQQKKFDHFVSRHCQKDGSIIDVEVNSTWLDIGEGQLVGFMQDITERKQAEETLHESESRYRSLFSNMINGFAYHKVLFNDMGKPIDYVYLEVNDAFENMTGLKKENVIGKRVTEVIPGIEEDPVDWIGIYGRVARSGEPMKFENYSEALKKWYSVSAYSQGKGCFATVFEDITKRKEMEMETQRLLTSIQQEKERLSALVNSINDEVWFADTQKRFTLANPSALSEFGLSSTGTIEIQAFTKNLEVYHSDGSPRPVEEAPPLRALKGEVLRNLEEIVRTPASGELRHRQVSAAPVADSRGNIIGSVSVVRDVTDRKRMEEALRTTKERFEILSETASRLLATHRPQELVNELCGKVMTYLDCHAFFNYLVDEEKQRLHLNACAGIPEETGKEIEWLDYGVAVCGCAARDASRIVCENIPATSDVRTELVKSFGIKAYACHPLFSAGRVIGTLSFGTRSRTTFTEEELSLMKTIADQVAMAMEKMSLIDALRKSRDELEIGIRERTAELANVNEGLRVEITERKRTEEALRKLTYDLNERVKEINCLYSVSYYVDKQHLLLNEKLKHIVNIIPSGWQFAKGTCARIVLEGQEYQTENFRETPWKQSSDIIVHGEKIGMIEVFYLEEKPEDYEGPFSKEERSLINAIAVELGEMIAHKRADEAVKVERQRFYDVLEMLPAYVVLLTPEYYVPFANRVFRERFGESYGKRCFEYLFGRSEPCGICETYTVLKTRARHHWEWTGPDSRIYDVFDFPFTDADGSTLILEMGIDVTERKRVEEALRTAHQYNRSLIEASLDPLVTISTDGKIMDVNRATEHVTGVVRKQLIGSDFSDYFTDSEKARDGYRQVFETGSVRDYPLAIRHTSGKLRDVLYNATVYRNEAGEVQGVFAAARDITERKRAEEALRESETRLRALSSQLLTAQESERKRIAMELHDGIGQMLTAIKFKVESILQEKGTGKARAKERSFEAIIPMVRESVEEVRRMQMDLRPSTLDDLGLLATLAWFCREYQKIYSHIHIEKEIGLQEDDISNTLKTVVYRLTQEAMNNIAKHSQADLIRLSLKRMENEIQLVVKDNGMGFDLEKILSSEGSKRGLGLSSMRERTELSGGKFMIESIQGKGTTLRASWTL